MHSTMSFPLVWRQTRRPQPLGKTTTTTQGSLPYEAFSRNSKEMSSRTRPNSSLTDFPCCNVFLEQVHDVLLLLSGIANFFLVSQNRKSIVDKWNTFESYDSNQEIHYERSFSFRCDLGLETWSLNGGGSSERLDNEILIPIKQIIE